MRQSVTGLFLFWKGSENMIYSITLLVVFVIIGLCMLQLSKWVQKISLVTIMNKKVKKQFWLTKEENDKFHKKAE